MDKQLPVCQLQVTLKELAHSRCWLFQKFHSNKLHDNLSKNKLHIMKKMNIKCIKVAKANNYKGLCIRHTFAKREKTENASAFETHSGPGSTGVLRFYVACGAGFAPGFGFLRRIFPLCAKKQPQNAMICPALSFIKYKPFIIRSSRTSVALAGPKCSVPGRGGSPVQKGACSQ